MVERAILAVLLLPAFAQAAQVAKEDGFPPNAPTEFVVVKSETTKTTVTLGWIAPSEGGWLDFGAYGGPVDHYEIAISGTTIYDFSWEVGGGITIIAGPVEVGQPGDPETFPVTGLQPDRLYHFSIRAISHDGTAGFVPNDVTERTLADTIRPSAINDLVVVAVDDQSVTLRWTAGCNDAGHPESGPAASYLFTYWNPLASGASFDTGTPVSMPSPASPGVSQAVTVDGLLSTASYVFAMKAGDTVGFGALSNEVRATTLLPSESEGHRAFCGGSASATSTVLASCILLLLISKRS